MRCARARPSTQPADTTVRNDPGTPVINIDHTRTTIHMRRLRHTHLLRFFASTRKFLSMIIALHWQMNGLSSIFARHQLLTMQRIPHFHSNCLCNLRYYTLLHSQITRHNRFRLIYLYLLYSMTFLSNNSVHHRYRCCSKYLVLKIDGG